MQSRPIPIAFPKFALFTLSLLPLAWQVWHALYGDLGANPVETLQRWTGIWTINFLVLTLCITPLRAISGQHWLLRLRRMLGLFCFFYALLHLLSFIWFDHEFAVDAIARDILKRPFVSVGFAAFVLLLPLALTSNNAAIRKLGGRKWQELHRSVYLIAILGCVHYFWLSKITQWVWPIGYSLVFALLLGWRINERRRKAIPVQKTSAVKPVTFYKQRPE